MAPVFVLAMFTGGWMLFASILWVFFIRHERKQSEMPVAFSVALEPDGIKCLTCGIVRSESWWLDEDVRQLCDQYGVNSLTEVLNFLKKDDSK
jgi:hypothetical protein